MTILLGKDNKAYYYFGLNTPADKTVPKPEMKVTDFSANGIRQVLLDRQRQKPEPIILIKATEDAKYKNMVDILDEMNITNQKKYALVKVPKDDLDLIKDSAL
jgi:biopolymer transport protein ExbD